jgi:phage tail sheath protein FI
LRPEHLSGDGTPPDVTWGLATLTSVSEVSIVAIPDIMSRPPLDTKYTVPKPRCDQPVDNPSPLPTEGAPDYPPTFSRQDIDVLQRSLVNHCIKCQDRVAVLDAGRTEVEPEALLARRQTFDTSYAALYAPWLRIIDPLNPNGPLLDLPPSGHVAGVYARGDLREGVHKPPANEPIEGAQDALVAFDDILHGILNDHNVNVIRPYGGRGVRVAGARTLASDPLWRYVNVRRLLIMIERAIDVQMQWAVFEPNNPDLWSAMDRTVRGFLDRLWRQGMLDGATTEEAYSVRCDETTNPPEETELGRMICLIGVQPPWPAEFVVVRVGRTEGGTVILEKGG